MNLDPRLYQPGLGRWDFPAKQRAIRYRKRCVLPLIFGMNVRQLVAFVIKKIHVDDNSINMLIVGIFILSSADYRQAT